MMDLSKSRNANKMKDIQKKSQEQSGTLVAISIPLSEIDENPDNETVFDMEEIKRLSENIKEFGFMGTINVFKKPDGRYEIFSGHRRYRAMKLLKRDVIPCTVDPYPDSYEKGMKLLSSNANNRVIKPLGMARMIDYYYTLTKQYKKEYEGRLRDKAAEFFGMSPVNIQRYHSLLNLIPELQEKANDPEFSYSAFTTAGTLTEEEQRLLNDRIDEEIERNSKNEDSLKNISRTRIQQLINDIKDKPDNTAQKNKANGNYVTNAVNSVPVNNDDETHKDVTGEVEAPDSFINKPIEVDSPTFSHEGDAGDYAAELSDDEDAGIVAYEQEDSILPDEKPRTASAETKLSAYIPEIEKIASGLYEINDPGLVKRYMKRLRAAIDAIEKKV